MVNSTCGVAILIGHPILPMSKDSNKPEPEKPLSLHGMTPEEAIKKVLSTPPRVKRKARHSSEPVEVLRFEKFVDGKRVSCEVRVYGDGSAGLDEVGSATIFEFTNDGREQAILMALDRGYRLVLN
jgi:hypothetical protein